MVSFTATVTVVAAFLSAPASQTDNQDERGQPSAAATLSAEQAFAAVDQLVAAGRTADAQVLLRALAGDPVKQLRSEARFRLGRLHAARGDLRGAIIWYQALLDEEPEAAAVRLELARIHARLGEAAAAARQLRRAQASRLPLNVARQVDRISAALRTSAARGIDFSIGLAPDTNINRATASRTIDAQGITLLIDRDGRARPGIGLQLGARGYSRLPLTSSTSWLVEASGAGTLYPAGRYDDLAGTIAIGPEFRSATAQLRPSLLVSRRYFDGRRLFDQAGMAMEGRRTIGRTAQVASSANISYSTYPDRPFLNGVAYGLSLDLEKAITSRLFGLVGVSGSRSNARDPAYAATSFGGRVFLSRDAGRVTLFSGYSYQHLVADAPFALFQTRRRDKYSDVQFGTSARLLAVRGFIPSVRLTLSNNSSTIPFYDFRRRRLELTLGRQL